MGAGTLLMLTPACLTFRRPLYLGQMAGLSIIAVDRCSAFAGSR